MIKSSTSLFLPRKTVCIFLTTVIAMITFAIPKTYSQAKVYANSVITASNVDNPSDALTANDATFATVKSYGGLALGAGAYTGELVLKFPATLPAGTTSFIRIDAEPTLLNQLLGGNLGGLLANVAGGIVLGNHVIEVGARNATGATVLSGSTSNGFTSSNLRLVVDANGYFYLAIRPNQDYDRVYIRDFTYSTILGTSNNTRVYYAFYTNGTDPCASAFATDFDGNGLTVDALGLGKAGVTNPGFAIDANLNNYSELSLGALGVAGSISQNFYFNSPSVAGDEFNLRIGVSSALLNAGVLNNLSVTAYNGNNRVYTQSASNLLSLDLIGLLNAGQPVTVGFSPSVPFDRVIVTLSSLLNVNLTQTILIYGLTRSPGRPTFVLPAINNVNTCYNAPAGLRATTNSTNELRWYNALQGGTALATTAYNGTFTTPPLTANQVYYVASRRVGCTDESVRVPVSVTVNPAIVFNATALNNASNGFAYTTQINAATGGTPGFSYALTSGSVLPPGLNLASSGLISGTPTATGSFNFSITATDSKGCTATANYTLVVTSALVLASGTLPNGTTGVSYPAQVIPPATGGTGPYIYSASNLPPGLTFNATTREITGIPAQEGNYSIPVTVTDATGNNVTANYSVKITDPLILPGATLIAGTTGQVYPAQVLPAATGGSTPYSYTVTNLPPGLNFNSATRTLTGTPSNAGTYVLPVTVTDADGRTATTNYTINITDPLLLPSATLAAGTAGTAYPGQIIPAATGGVAPYTYVASGVPSGLTFEPLSRSLTGTPAQAGNYTIYVTVTDDEGRTASNTYGLTVNGVLSLPTASLPNGTVGLSYPPQTLPGVSGGTAPYTYTAANLPPGLTFNTATRELSGTPSSGGTFIISVTGTDANNNKVNTDYMIVITVNQPVVANVSVCEGNTATLNVSNLQSGITYNWYGPTGGTALSTNNSGVFTTPVVNSSTTFYVEAVSGTAVSGRIAVNVSVNPAPNPAIVTTNNQVINPGQSTMLMATADAGITIKWYDAAAGGTALATGSNFTTPVLSSTTTYYAETINSDGCTSDGRVAVTVTVINVGGGTACNTANSQNAGITGLCLLCSISGPGNSVDANPDNYTRISLTAGVTATGFQQLLFPSAGAATDSIRLDLGLPTGLADLSILSNITVNLMNGNVVVSSYPLSSSILNLRLLGGNRFTATFPAGAVYDRVELRFGGLISAVSSLDIYGATVIYPNPTVINGSQTICSGNTATLSVTPNGGTSLRWFDAPTGGTLLSSGPTFTTPALNTTTTYFLEVANGSCANVGRLPFVITVTPVVALPVLAPVANICSGSAATLSVNNPDPALVYNWFDAASGGTLLFSGTTFITPALTANTSYYLEAANGNCVSNGRATANVIVNPAPLVPTVNASSSVINPGQTVTLTASSSENGVTFKWYDAPASTAPLFTGETFITPPLNTTTTYYVEAVSASGCASASRVQITITVNGSGTTVAIPCEVAVSQVNGTTGNTLLAGVFNPGLAVDNDTQTASSLVMPVGVLNASVYQRLYFGDLSNAGDTLHVLISFPQAISSAGILNNISITSYNGTSSNNDPIFLNNAAVNVKLLSGNTQALITIIPAVPYNGAELRLNSGLLGALTSVNLNYMQKTLLAPQVVSSNVSGCANLTTVLQVQNPVAGITYRWFNALQNPLTDGPTFTTPALAADTKFYVAIVSASGCISAKTIVNVTVQQAPATPELVSPVVTACTGSTIILQVKNPVNGITYKWYTGNGNVNSAGPDGPNLTVTPPPNSNYTVVAVNSCGTASAGATATINVGNSPQAPVITPSSATVVSGTSVVLTASSSVVGARINWYSDENLSVLVAANTNTFTTPVLNTNTIYYVTATVSSCGVSEKALVAVTVIPPAPGTAPCGFATAMLVAGATGINAGAGVINQSAAVDDDANTGSTLFIPVGAAGATAYQRVGFNGGLSNTGDTLRVKISSPGKLLTASTLPDLTLTTYNGSADNGDTMTLMSQLIQLNLAGDGSEATLTFIPAKQFDAVELRLNSGALATFTTVNFNYAQRSITKPEVSAATATACVGSSALLSVNNPKPGIVYKWYLGTAYQIGKDGVNFLTDPSLAVGSYDYFVTAAGINGCETTPVKIVVSIVAPPAIPVASAGNPASTCLNTPVTLNVQPVTGTIYNWYDAAVSGTLLVSNSSSFTTPSNLAAGSYTYYVEAASVSGCANANRIPVAITINQNANPGDVVIAGNTSLCFSGTTVLTAGSTTVINPVFTWYTDAALTNNVFTGATFTTPKINSNTTYYVGVTGTNRCASLPGNAATVTLTINPVAIASDISITGPGAVCAGSNATLTAGSAIPNAIFNWYSDAALTTLVFTGPSFTTQTLNADVTYYVTVKGDGKCENQPSTAKVVLVKVSPATTASDISITGANVICKNSGITLTASSATVTNPVFTWYNDPALTSVVYNGASFTTPALTATTSYYVTISGDNYCAGTAANAKTVTVTVKYFATAADINLSNVNICSGTSATLSASSLTVTQPVFTWYSDASLTIPVYTGPTYNVSATATTNFYVTVKGTNKCENTAADAKLVTVTVNPLATTTDIIISGNTTVCNGTSSMITASSATVINPVFTWYEDAGLTNIAYVGAAYATPVFSSNATYYVTVKGDNKCENMPSSAKIVQVTVSGTPASPVISVVGTAICYGSATTLNIQNPQAGVTYEWYNASNGGSLLYTGTSFTTPVLTAETSYYVQAVAAGGCLNPSGRIMITVTVSMQPQVPAVSGNALSVCYGSTATLSITNVQPGTVYNWYATATGGTVLATGPAFTTPALTNNSTYYAESASGSCISNSRTPVNITVSPLPAPPASVTALNAQICSGNNTVLRIESPDAGLSYKWYNVGTGGTVLGQGSTFSTVQLTETSVFYVESINASGCSSPSRTPVTVTVLPVLTAPLVQVQGTTSNSITFAWNAVTGASGYEISTDNGLSWQLPSSGSTSTSHLVSGLKPGQRVDILVRAKGQLSCQNSANSTTVTGKAQNPLGNEVYIPNIFTPNNDGKNDIFLVYGTAIASVKMNIYTQWGQLIYQVNSATSGWDGSYKGVAQPNGVYVYLIDVELNDGTKMLKKGTLTLIR